MTSQVYIVGEDQLCCALGSALVFQSGMPARIECSQVMGGFGPFRAKIDAMNTVADRVMPVLMVADADQFSCVVEQRNSWMPKHAASRLSLRLVVREAEAWILADREGFCEFAQISVDLMPHSPEEIDSPKEHLLHLIKKSKRRQLRDEMLPARNSRSRMGLGYNLHMSEFVSEYWNAQRAAERSPSLARSIPRVAALLAK